MHNIKSIQIFFNPLKKQKKKISNKIKSFEVYLTEKATLEIGHGGEGGQKESEGLPSTGNAPPRRRPSPAPTPTPPLCLGGQQPLPSASTRISGGRGSAARRAGGGPGRSGS